MGDLYFLVPFLLYTYVSHLFVWLNVRMSIAAFPIGKFIQIV